MFGAFAGCLAISLSVSGPISLALVALMLAGLADLFDGYVARRLKMSAFEKEFGVQLDTIVDVVSFVAAPAVIGVSLSNATPLVVLCVMLYMLAGVVRLAHFNTQANSGQAPTGSHLGLPVTYAALVLPMVLVPMSALGPALFQFCLGFVFLGLAILFLAPVTVPKPRGVFYIVFPVLAALFASFWIWTAINQTWIIK